MFGRSTKKPQKSTDANAHRHDLNSPSVIASNMCVLGNIVSAGVLDIDGQVDGNVRGHMITLRPNARVRGDVIAEEVHVHGTVDGLIKAQNVMLYSTAHVHGTIMHETVTIEDGAAVDGKLKRMERLLLEDLRDVAAPAPSAAAAAAASADSLFMNDNDEPQSEAEIRILDNLRLIS